MFFIKNQYYVPTSDFKVLQANKVKNRFAAKL